MYVYMHIFSNNLKLTNKPGTNHIFENKNKNQECHIIHNKNWENKNKNERREEKIKRYMKREI